MKTRTITIDNGKGRFTGELTDLRMGEFQLISDLTEAPRGWITNYVWMPIVDIYPRTDPDAETVQTLGITGGDHLLIHDDPNPCNDRRLEELAYLRPDNSTGQLLTCCRCTPHNREGVKPSPTFAEWVPEFAPGG